MKKIAIAFWCILLNIVALCSCGFGQEAQEALPELIIGGADYAPYFYTDTDEYTGIDVDIATEACRRMGYRPVFRELDLDNRAKALENGMVDCLWTCLTMDGREEKYTWAGPYLYTRRVYAVAADSKIRTKEDLTGVKLAVQADSASEETILEQESNGTSDFSEIVTYRSVGEVFMALRRGYVDAVAGHEGALRIYTEEYPGEYSFLDMNLLRSRLGVAFRKGDHEELAAELTRTMDEMIADGTMVQILEKYGLDVEQNLYGGTEE